MTLETTIISIYSTNRLVFTMNTVSVLCSTLSMLPQPVLLSVIRTDTRVSASHTYSRCDRLQPLPGPDYHEAFNGVPQWPLKLCNNCLFILSVQCTTHYHPFIHSVFCLTTGPKPPLKRFLHIVRSRASFKLPPNHCKLRGMSSEGVVRKITYK